MQHFILPLLKTVKSARYAKGVKSGETCCIMGRHPGAGLSKCWNQPNFKVLAK